MPPMKFDDKENRRADEETKSRSVGSIPAGGKDVGGKDNKRADFGVKERKSPGPKTTGGSKIPAKVASFSGERV